MLSRDSEFWDLHYNIKGHEPLSIDNCLSLIFYTDYSELSYQFSKSFRKISPKETNDELKERNAAFWHWSKKLRETIECWGQMLYSSEIRVLYHGVSFMYFGSFIARFCSPTSMTTQLPVCYIKYLLYIWFFHIVYSVYYECSLFIGCS